MNYLTEIRLFNEWLETSEATTSGIALWYALMHIANRSGWKPELCIPVSALCLRTKLSRSAIYKERSVLRDAGLIDFDVGDGRQSSIYKIVGFEERFASTLVSTTATQTENSDEAGPEVSTVMSTTETQECTQNVENPEPSTLASTTRTQPEIQPDFVSTTRTQQCTIYKQKDISLDENQEKKKGVVRGKKEPTLEAGAEASLLGYAQRGGGRRSQKPDFDLSFIGDEVWEALVESWLEYKRSRSENYKSELSVKKFHTMLRNYSRGDPGLARQIIDKSIANNWAGIFEPVPEDGKPRNPVGQPARPATGQRIGQIKQPEDEERRRKLLEKFGRSGDADKK